MMRSGRITLVMGFLFLQPIQSGLAQNEPHYQDYLRDWEDLVSRYAGSHPAVILEHTVQVNLKIESRTVPIGIRWEVVDDSQTETVEETICAIFDPRDSGPLLDHAFFVNRNTTIVAIRTWSIEPGEKEVEWSNPGDAYVAGEGGTKFARIGVPGLSGPGLCGFQYVTVTDRATFVGRTFTNSYPVLRGEISLVMPNIGSFQLDEELKRINTAFDFHVYGDPVVQPPVMAPEGLKWKWIFRNLASSGRNRLSPRRGEYKAAVFMSARSLKWKDYVTSCSERLEKLTAPREMVESLRGTLDTNSTESIISGVIEYLDDPTNFDLQDEFFFFTGLPDAKDIKSLARIREGNPLDKAVLAHLLLQEFGVDNNLAFGASRYSDDLEWERVSPENLGIALIHVPAMGPNYLLDVANYSVPPGVPGSDLYDEVLLVSRNLESPVTGFHISPGTMSQVQRAVLDLTPDGAVTGNLQTTYYSWPQINTPDFFQGVRSEFRLADPWKPATEQLWFIDRLVAPGVSVGEPFWTPPPRRLRRCDFNNPAILSGNVALEAFPLGNSSWEVHPLIFQRPGWLPPSRQLTGRDPILMDRQVDIIDSILVRSGALRLTKLPAELRRHNRFGSLDCEWEMVPEGVLVVRHLQIRPEFFNRAKLPYLREIAEAWEESTRRVLVFEPSNSP